MEIIKYNTNIVPNPFGLIGNGYLCYLNSLTQCLLSISSFNSDVLNKTTPLANIYKDIYNNKTNNTSKFLVELINNNKNINIHNGSQEDVHEVFNYIINTLGNEYRFHIRYDTVIKCDLCNHIILNKSPCETFVSISTNIDKSNLESYIYTNSEKLDTYTCDKCKSKQVTLTNILKRTSEVIVILYKKYNNKYKSSFPHILEFQSTKGPLRYILVGQIEHFGNMFGGHYTSKCMRKLKVYSFNDSSISNSSFSQSDETYMLFYHII